MNQNLKAIKDLLQQNNQLTEQDKEVLLKAITDADKQWNITEFKLERTEKVKKTTAILLEETIEELEQKRKAVETQNRELEIEASLERVRTQAMGMHTLEQLVEVCKALYTELKTLGFNNIRNAQIAINNDEKGFYLNYEYSDSYSGVIEVFYNSHPNVQALVNEMKKSKDAFFEIEIAGKELNEWRAWRINTGETPDPLLDNATMLCYYFYSVGAGALGISTFDRITIAELNILKRFRNVFELAYRRYSDIEKAEAQAREARIEVALERVRARAMAMQNSDELSELVSTLFKELTQLDFELTSCVIWINNPESATNTLWVTSSEMHQPARPIFLKPFYHSFFKSIIHAWKAKDPKWIFILSGDEKNSFEKDFFKDLPDLPGALRSALEVPEKVVFSATFNNFGALEVIGTEPLTDEKFDILHRFGKVFDSSYTRFNDLKKAEAQAREAQIEASLERVRAKVMTMNSSKDLNETSLVFGEQLRKLGIDWQFSYFWLIEEDKDDNTFWITWPDNKTSTTSYSLAEADEAFRECIIAWKQQVKIHSTHVPAQDVQAWLDTFDRITADAGGVAVEIMKADNFKDGVFYYDAMIKFGSFGILMNRATNEEEKNIQSRFAVEFERAYTRFLDLKKAEAQAREAQIELALERVRAKTMAMQKSEELHGVNATIIEQIKFFEPKLFSTGIHIVNPDKPESEAWIGDPTEGQMPKIICEHTQDPLLISMYKGWKEGKQVVVERLEGIALKIHFEQMIALLPKTLFENVVPPDLLIYHYAYFSKGFFVVVTREENSELPAILKRFANVFEQTYTRFLDLQNAEAQARESQIQLALERVRARTMAMHRSEELAETAQVLFHQLQELGGIPDRIAIGVVDEPDGVVNFWTTDQLGSHIDKSFKARLNERTVISKTYREWKDNKRSLVIDLHGEDVREWIQFAREELGITLKDELIKDRRVHSLAFFSHGWIHVTSHELQSAETIQILERFASVFNLTYRRFLDLQKAEVQAREAQIELALERVRARAMAMQNSDELKELIGTVFTELTKLDLVLTRCVIMIYNGEANDTRWWMANSEDPENPMGFYIKPHNHPPIAAYFKAWKERQLKWTYVLEGQIKKDWDVFLFNETELKTLPDFVIEGMKAPDRVYLNASFNNFGNLTLASLEPLSDEHFDILLRFAKVFDLTYTRFNDLQKAEAQARESQIELGLERVRARAMAMQKSDELRELIETVSAEMNKLDLVLGDGRPAPHCMIAIFDPTSQGSTWWMAASEINAGLMGLSMKYHEHPPYLAYLQAWKTRQVKWQYIIEGDIKRSWDEFVFSETEFSLLPEVVIANMKAQEKVFLNASFNAFGCLTLATTDPLTEAQFDIMIRFAKVFDLTYTRFNDLKQAELQAREAKIEASLERVRAKAMAMHKSEDLNTAVATVFEELDKLNLGMARCGIGILDKEKRSADVWTTSAADHGNTLNVSGDESMDIHPLLQGAFDAWLKQTDFSYVLEGKDLARYYQAVGKTNIQLPDSQIILSGDEGTRQYYYIATFQAGGLFAFRDTPFSEEAKKVMRRFADVFNLTYTRFLDLQKAEAQAREAKIETALERVRSKALAMHSSEDLAETIKVFYQQLALLNLMPRRCGVGLIDKETNVADLTGMIISEQGEAKEITGKLKLTKHPVLENVYNNWVLQKEYHPILRGNEIKEYYQLIGSQISFQEYLPDAVQFGYFFYFPEGAVYAWREKEFSEDELKIYRRFTTVLSLTYKRYMDLKLAESQAREATIEAALEKVRGMAMGMHNSKDLTATAGLAFTELRKLGINLFRGGVSLQSRENRKNLLYSAISGADGDSFSLVGSALLDGHPILSAIYDNWLRNEDYFPVLKVEDIETYYEKIGSNFLVPDSHAGKEQYGYYLPFSEGSFYGWSEKPFTEAEIKILKRFATVIDLTFRRYMELQKSEANASEAVKQAALDRVRAEIASMRTTGDLERITPLIWNELTILGIPFIRCGVFIMDEAQKLIHTFLSTPDGKAIAAFHIPYDTPGNISQVLSHWHDKETYIDHWDESAFTEFAGTLVKQGVLTSPDQYLSTLPRGGFYLHFLPFLQGMLYVGNTTQLDEDEIKLLQSVADAFSTAYARYEDFNKLEAAKQQVDNTLVDLKQAQQQLVQSEKMASLGELTAGIAHEIQNPLNFVNNFSEVSNELIDEMITELGNNNKEDAIAIADDVKQNLEKILHHGKRADGIVKGMLQHSRSSTGQKEPTDINALADEYLRLAYHGLRAKDKSFNAKFETDFDSSIEKINVIPQEIGRVILNLINNAFYAVTERKKQNGNARLPDGPGYEPTVKICTKKMNGKIEIKVKDNGIGIPQKVVDKIYQPFFTTKPTGQGTGLGLSLSYDIVKAHGGVLKVETKEGEGSEFIIQLPNHSS